MRAFPSALLALYCRLVIIAILDLDLWRSGVSTSLQLYIANC